MWPTPLTLFFGKSKARTWTSSSLRTGGSRWKSRKREGPLAQLPLGTIQKHASRRPASGAGVDDGSEAFPAQRRLIMVLLPVVNRHVVDGLAFRIGPPSS